MLPAARVPASGMTGLGWAGAPGTGSSWKASVAMENAKRVLSSHSTLCLLQGLEREWEQQGVSRLCAMEGRQEAGRQEAKCAGCSGGAVAAQPVEAGHQQSPVSFHCLQ